jgi:hypothetical protein
MLDIIWRRRYRLNDSKYDALTLRRLEYNYTFIQFYAIAASHEWWDWCYFNKSRGTAQYW